MSFWSNLFKKTEVGNKTRTGAVDYPVVDFTNNIVADVNTTKKLYRNTLPGYKLAGVFAKNIIDTPIAFCGAPSPQTDDEDIIKFFKKYNPDFTKILKQAHREGTVWIWPWFNSKRSEVKLKFIEDNQVSEIEQDPTTDEIVSVTRTRTINLKNKSVQEKTVYTRSKITTTYDSVYKNSVKRNILGILPINFTNMAEGGEIRGISDYENILPDLQDYHRTALSMSVQLNDFKTKLVQTIEGNPDQWAEDQGFADLNDFIINSSPQKVSMIFNGKDDKTEFLTAKGAIDSNIAALKISYKKIVQGCRVPELFWGLKQEGNHATAEESMTALINLVDEKRIQANANLELLMNSMLRLDLMSRGQVLQEEISLTWNQLDAVSDISRSEIFKNFCDGISKAFNAGVLTPGMAYDLWRENYPSATNITEAEFLEGIKKTTVLLQKQKTSYTETMGEDVDQL